MGLEAVRTLQGPIMGVDEFLYSLPSPRSECTRRRRPHACGHSQHRHDQAAAERPADGQPPPSHSSVAPPYRTASGRAANLPFAFRSSPHERQQRLSAGPLRKLARTLAYTARRRTATAAGLFGRDAPTNAMCSSHRRLRARARIDEGLMRDTAEASVTHHAARLIPPAGGPSRSAGSVARTSRPPHM